MKNRKLLPTEQAFLDAYKMTIQEAQTRNWIVRNKTLLRHGTGERCIGWSPSQSGDEYSNAFDAMACAIRIRDAKEAAKSPDLKEREAIWAKLTDVQRRAIRQNPAIWDKPDGALDWEFLTPYR